MEPNGESHQMRVENSFLRAFLNKYDKILNNLWKFTRVEKIKAKLSPLLGCSRMGSPNYCKLNHLYFPALSSRKTDKNAFA